MPSLGEAFTKAYTTFSGIDITAIFDDKTLLTVSGVSCSVTREKAPVYTFGSATPRSISRGKRGIAGSIVGTMFDRHTLMELFQDPRKWYYAHRNEVNWLRNPVNAAAPNRIAPNIANSAASLSFGRTGQFGRNPRSNQLFGPNDEFTDILQVPVPGGQFESNVPTTGGFQISNLLTGASGNIPAGAIVDGQAVTIRRAAVYADQLLPFDVTLVAQNELGQAAWCTINACEIINEGKGMSVDDITSEEQFTFIAIHTEPWRPLDPAGGELQNVGAQTSFGIDNEGNIATDSDAGTIDPAWAPFYRRDIDGQVRNSQDEILSALGGGGTTAITSNEQELGIGSNQQVTFTPLN